MMSLTFGLFTQVSGSGPLGPLVLRNLKAQEIWYGNVNKSEFYFEMGCHINLLIGRVFFFLPNWSQNA